MLQIVPQILAQSKKNAANLKCAILFIPLSHFFLLICFATFILVFNILTLSNNFILIFQIGVHDLINVITGKLNSFSLMQDNERIY